MESKDFIISDLAAKEILAQAKKRNSSPIIRVGLRGGGCSGFSILLEWWDMTSITGDLFFSNQGAEVVIDPKSLIYLKGSALEFETSLMGRGFKINSPLQKGACGCGASVQF